MKLSRFNIVIFIGFFAILGVIIMQFFLLNQAYSFEKKEVESKIHYALRDVVERIYIDNNSELIVSNQIKKIAHNYYVVNVNDVFENNILEFYLKKEFNRVNLDLDFEYAIYDCGSNNMVYGNYIDADGDTSKKCEDCFTKNHDLIYYFAIRFPTLKQNYFSSLKQYWIYTVVLFIVLIIYVYSVLLMLKQKRYTVLQNDFINNMTHEFKTPLASILIASNYANSQDEIKKSPKLSKYIEIIINQSKKLNQHIEQILSLAKTDSHNIQLNKTKVELSNIVKLIKENILLKYSREITFTLLFPKKYTVLADEFHFYNILYNIVDNAIKYTKGNPDVTMMINDNVKYVTLSISDNGDGVSEKDLPFIFDKFYRVERKDSKEIEGFGIGLAYVKKICQLHNWKISASSTETGLTISIQIPKTDIYE
ncbi:histidine kinase [Flavobacterium sp. 316]|uniref:histidine kinase n=1 Tax=Flavobacterium sediminilitoris TaxID=2024526 RepID=A0ABY4HQK2_9FLAO|nr:MULTISPECIES: HAMP domain-containing sensor histidine kinase [Flavobacterium]KIX21099.1 histidine kinase [Flavobacterium sp. 316]UOX35171.1 HAMP domain-containing histidine kinase [Flavobacterium sediminilitoris]